MDIEDEQVKRTWSECRGTIERVELLDKLGNANIMTFYGYVGALQIAVYDAMHVYAALLPDSVPETSKPWGIKATYQGFRRTVDESNRHLSSASVRLLTIMIKANTKARSERDVPKTDSRYFLEGCLLDGTAQLRKSLIEFDETVMHVKDQATDVDLYRQPWSRIPLQLVLIEATDRLQSALEDILRQRVLRMEQLAKFLNEDDVTRCETQNTLEAADQAGILWLCTLF